MKIINLLPPSEIDLIRKEKLFGAIRAATILTILSYIAVIVVLIGGRLYLQSSSRSLDAQIKQDEEIISKQDNAALRKQVDSDNSIIRDYKVLQTSNPRWSNVLVELAKLVPGDVGISSFNASTTSGQVNISGKADTREGVLQFRSNVAASPLFQKIDLPLENLAKPTNLNYHYTFFLNANVLISK